MSTRPEFVSVEDVFVIAVPYLDGRASCAETDPEAFFPQKGESARPAKSICRLCEMQPECLEWALGNAEQWGIWAGMTVRERQAELRRRARVARGRAA